MNSCVWRVWRDRLSSSRRRRSSTAKSNSVRLKVAVLGVKVTRVPRFSPAGPTTFSGASASPWRKRIQCSCPSRHTVSSSHSLRAFTTETPTPCSPPDTL